MPRLQQDPLAFVGIRKQPEGLRVPDKELLTAATVKRPQHHGRTDIGTVGQHFGHHFGGSVDDVKILVVGRSGRRCHRREKGKRGAEAKAALEASRQGFGVVPHGRPLPLAEVSGERNVVSVFRKSQPRAGWV